MHPAYSVIFFTVASGAGYGALVWLAVLSASGALAPTFAFGAAAFALALGLVTFGLVSSAFHLGRPERAWRGLLQWRSSWLSREGIAALLTYVPALVFAAAWLGFAAHDAVRLWAGALTALSALATVACTGMIYASLRAVPRWTDPLVVPVYVGFSVSSGAVLVTATAAAFGFAPGAWAWLAALATALAWAMKAAYWRRIDAAAPRASARSATGLGALGEVRLLESPHSGDNYIMREMGYAIARKHAVRLRRIAMAAGGLAPVLALGGAGFLDAPLALAAMLAACAGAGVGILVERWLFFAEARHAAALYYGAQEV